MRYRTVVGIFCFLSPVLVIVGLVDLLLPVEIIEFGGFAPVRPVSRWLTYFATTIILTVGSWSLWNRLPPD